MNKTLSIVIAALLALGLILIFVSKINPQILFVIGICAIIVAVILTAFVLYKNYKKD